MGVPFPPVAAGSLQIPPLLAPNAMRIVPLGGLGDVGRLSGGRLDPLLLDGQVAGHLERLVVVRLGPVMRRLVMPMLVFAAVAPWLPT